MTIATKPLESKDKVKSGSDAVVIEKPVAVDDSKTEFVESTYNAPVTPVHVYMQRRRRRMVLTFCIGLLGLWFLTVSIVGGIMLYRYMNRKPNVYGWCGTDVNYRGHMEKFHQRVEIDQTLGYERLEVPEFSWNRPATFFHDFGANVSAIIDIRGQQCLVKPLSPHLLPPKSYADLLEKLQDGYYEPKSKILEQRYMLRRPALTYAQLHSLGSYFLDKHCHRYATFWLQKMSPFDMKRSKRSSCVENILTYGELLPTEGLVKDIVVDRKC